MTKIEQIEHFQTRVHRFSLLMPTGDSHHHTLYIMYGTRFKSPKKVQGFEQKAQKVKDEHKMLQTLHRLNSLFAHLPERLSRIGSQPGKRPDDRETGWAGREPRLKKNRSRSAVMAPLS